MQKLEGFMLLEMQKPKEALGNKPNSMEGLHINVP